MKAIWRDMLWAILLGILFPGAMLNTAVIFRGSGGQQETVALTAPAETEGEGSGITVMRIQPDGSLVQQELEEYLVGVVLAEMPASFESEALKAQAVAARTYTRKAMETGGKHGNGSVCSQASCCQAYLSVAEYREKGGTEEGVKKVRTAVRETAGQCLYYGEELIEATYFSCSGGRTEDAVAVWGAAYPYLQSVESPGEEGAAHYRDVVTMSAEEFAWRLGRELSGDPRQWLGAISYTAGGGVDRMEIGGESYSGTQLRNLLELPSTAFTITVSEDVLTVTTRGYGHRVGMSQYGADAMAVQGSTYREILAHYYPGTEIKQIG